MQLMDFSASVEKVAAGSGLAGAASLLAAATAAPAAFLASVGQLAAGVGGGIGGELEGVEEIGGGIREEARTSRRLRLALHLREIGGEGI